MSRRRAGFTGPGAWHLVVLAGILLYCLVFYTLSARQHDALRTSYLDVGNVDQAVWNTLHGRPFRFTGQPEMGDNRLGMHVDPILLLITPLYLVASSPKTLLAVQTLALGLSAWPLYLLARRRLASRGLASGAAAALVALSYLLWPALESVTLFEFHAVSLAPLFLLTSLYCVEAPPQGRYVLGFAASAVLAMMCKEDIALTIAAMGVFLFLRRCLLLGALTALGGAAWFYASVYVIIPHFGGGASPFIGYFDELGGSPLTIGWAILTQPAAAWRLVATPSHGRALIALLAPLAGLPLFGLRYLWLAIPALSITFLSASASMRELEAYHYAAPLIPLFAAAAVEGLAVVAGRNPHPPAPSPTSWVRGKWASQARLCIPVVLLLLASASYHYARGFSPLARPYQPIEVTAHDRLLTEMIRQIPPSARVAAQSNLFPHVSEREWASVWPNVRDAEYVLLDVSSIHFSNSDGAHQALKREIEGGRYGVLDARDGYVLLKRDGPRRPLPDAFYTFAQVPDGRARIDHPMGVEFGDAIRFLGLSREYGRASKREGEVFLALYFEALRPLSKDYFISIYLLDEQGKAVGSTDVPQPAEVWYPTHAWAPGQIVRVVVNSFSWQTEGRDAYRLALGIVDGEDTWNRALRLRPRGAGKSEVRSQKAEVDPQGTNQKSLLLPSTFCLLPSKTLLPEDGTLLQLAGVRRWCDIPYLEVEPRRFDPPRSEHAADGRWPGGPSLVGFDREVVEGADGRALRLRLVWKTEQPMANSYTVFLHVLDPDGHILAQQDGQPVSGLYPTDAWAAGEYVEDVHIIPLNFPGSQPFDIALGLYRLDTLERLPLADGSTQLTVRGIE